MTLTKYGHSCVLIDDGRTKILFDPGSWSDIPDIAVDAIVITHIHGDHIDMKKHGKLFASAPRIITQSEVKVELDRHQVANEIVEDGESVMVGSMTLAGVGSDHAIIHPNLPKFRNTGYLVDGKIFHPGDNLTVPAEPVETLLLPIVAPWSKVEETMNYVSSVQPKRAFAIHDGFINSEGHALFAHFGSVMASQNGMEFIQPELGKIYEI